MATTVASGAVGSGLLTLVANTVTTVNFGEDLNVVEVLNPGSNTDAVWFSLDGNDPSVGGANSYLVPAGFVDQRDPKTGTATTVKLLSTGTPTVLVQRGD